MKKELIVKYDNLPLKAYGNNEEVKEILENHFSKWLIDLLGLTGKESAKRLIMALPSIEKHFWSLGFMDIKKAFEMYVDGELKTQPIPNYFTRMLVGQIFKDFKELSRTKTENKMEKDAEEREYKKQQDDLAVIVCYDRFIQDRKIHKDLVWIYDYLEDKIGATAQEKRTLFSIAMEQKVGEAEAKKLCKLKLINRYFEKLEAKGIHVKEVL